MKKIAVFPGSFDPFTLGHEQIVRRALPLFDQIIVAIGVNSRKEGLFPVNKRVHWIEKTFEGEPKVTVDVYEGLTINYCEKVGAEFLVRGLRNTIDFEFESGIANMNKAMMPSLETIFILTTPELSALNSTIVRDIIKNGGNAAPFVPAAIDLYAE
jgi:pantetheine-phosphate adenylyltransferase